MLGHRRTWAVEGNYLDQTNRHVLNHMCGFRPCCNPLHLEQVSHYQNNAHGKIMDVAVSMTERGMDMPDGVDLMHRLSRDLLGVSSQALQDFWE